MNEISQSDSEITPYYLMYGLRDEVEVKKHIALFKQLGIINYSFVHNAKTLYLFAKDFHNHSFLLHGVTYACMCVLIFAGVRLSWVCWGAGASINRNNWKSVLATPLKILIYRRFHAITTLMDGDKITLEHDYLLKGVEVLPYYA